MILGNDFILAAIAVLVAGIVRGFSGFGAGLILVPSLSLLYGPVVAVVSVVLMELIPGIQLLPSALARCHWRSVVPMAIAAIVTLPAGSYVLIHTDAESMQVLIGVLVLLGVLVMASKPHYQISTTSNKATYVTGAVSGILSGSTGLGGLPVVMYYLSSLNRAAETRASMVVFLFITMMVSLVTFMYHGIISKEIIYRCLTLIPVLIFATWIGGLLFGKVTDKAFRYILLSFLGGIAILTLVH